MSNQEYKSNEEMMKALKLASRRIAFMIYKVDGETQKVDSLVKIEGQDGRENLDYICKVIEDNDSTTFAGSVDINPDKKVKLVGMNPDDWHTSSTTDEV